MIQEEGTYGYIGANGYLERNQGGLYAGRLTIEGVDLSPIEGVYFKEKGEQYLWLKRRPLLEYDPETMSYVPRDKEPRWEAYLKKQRNGVVAYKGVCVFLRFKFSIVGIWDKTANPKKNRLNLFAERLPRNEQTLINATNDRNRQLYGEKARRIIERD